jgi:hypothetical protein
VRDLYEHIEAVYLRRRKGAGGGAGEGPKRCSSLRVGIIYERVCVRPIILFLARLCMRAHTFAPRSACWRSCQLSFAPSEQLALMPLGCMCVCVFKDRF